MIAKRLFVGVLRALEHMVVPPVKVAPDWELRGASITVNGEDIATTVAKKRARS